MSADLAFDPRRWPQQMRSWLSRLNAGGYDVTASSASALAIVDETREQINPRQEELARRIASAIWHGRSAPTAAEKHAALAAIGEFFGQYRQLERVEDERTYVDARSQVEHSHGAGLGIVALTERALGAGAYDAAGGG